MDARRQATLVFWIANVAIGTVIGLVYLDGLRIEHSPRAWWFAHLGLVSTIATISLIPVGAVWLLERVFTAQGSRAAARAVVWMLFHVGLVIDTRVWGLFRYHFNSAAWNLITSKGSEDSYRLGARIWTFAFALAALLVLGEWLLWRVLNSARAKTLAARAGRRAVWVGSAAILIAICVEKSIYASADLDPSIESVRRALPLYPRLPVEAAAGAVALDGQAPPLCLALEVENARLAPPDPPAIDPHGPRPNILLVVIDSWRRDMLAPDVTPHLQRFAESARRFEDHTSGGNGTRFGVFSLLYGWHGSYWWPVLAAERGPPLLDVLDAAGYELRVVSSASMDYPEFRRTAWVGRGASVFDDFGERRSSERDQLVAEHCLEWWSTRDPAQPFFGFVLLDSAHQKYDFPEACARFTPFAREIDYLEMAGSREPELVELVLNRYRNAVLHADQVAAQLLDGLERLGLADDTVVIVTGDHGEEFTENGYWGHTGNFTAEQVAVPFLMRGPGVRPGVERAPTAHVDVAPTLLEILGADPAERARWCNGESLFAPPPRRSRVFAGWEEVGLWTASGIFRLPRAADSGFRASVCDARWQPLDDPRPAFTREREALRELQAACSRFLETQAVAVESR